MNVRHVALLASAALALGCTSGTSSSSTSSSGGTNTSSGSSSQGGSSGAGSSGAGSSGAATSGAGSSGAGSSGAGSSGAGSSGAGSSGAATSGAGSSGAGSSGAATSGAGSSGTATSGAGSSGGNSSGTATSGAGSSGGNSSGGGGDATQACSAFGTALCAKMEACGSFAFNMTYANQAECVAAGQTGCIGTVGLNGSGLTVSTLSECAAAMPNVSCDDFINGTLPAVCNPTGTLTNGAACASPVQCTTGVCNIGQVGVGCGTCGDAVAIGQPCTPGTACADNGVCVTDQMGMGGICKAPGAMGATCDFANPCLPSLACAGGTCGAPLTEGSPCNPQEPACAVGLECTFGNTPTCQPITVSGTGEPCGYDITSMSFSLCGAGGTCNGEPAGICVAPAGQGMSCNPVMGPNCSAGLDCVNGTCAPAAGPPSCN